MDELDVYLNDVEELDDLWNEYDYTPATWASRVHTFRALVLKIVKETVEDTTRIVLMFDPESIEIKEGDAEAPTYLEPLLKYNSKKGSLCGWSYAQKAFKEMGAGSQQAIEGHYITFVAQEVKYGQEFTRVTMLPVSIE